MADLFRKRTVDTSHVGGDDVFDELDTASTISATRSEGGRSATESCASTGVYSTMSLPTGKRSFAINLEKSGSRLMSEEEISSLVHNALRRARQATNSVSPRHRNSSGNLQEPKANQKDLVASTSQRHGRDSSATNHLSPSSVSSRQYLGLCNNDSVQSASSLLIDDITVASSQGDLDDLLAPSKSEDNDVVKASSSLGSDIDLLVSIDEDDHNSFSRGSAVGHSYSNASVNSGDDIIRQVEQEIANARKAQEASVRQPRSTYTSNGEMSSLPEDNKQEALHATRSVFPTPDPVVTASTANVKREDSTNTDVDVLSGDVNAATNASFEEVEVEASETVFVTATASSGSGRSQDKVDSPADEQQPADGDNSRSKSDHVTNKAAEGLKTGDSKLTKVPRVADDLEAAMGEIGDEFGTESDEEGSAFEGIHASPTDEKVVPKANVDTIVQSKEPSPAPTENDINERSATAMVVSDIIDADKEELVQAKDDDDDNHVKPEPKIDDDESMLRASTERSEPKTNNKEDRHSEIDAEHESKQASVTAESPKRESSSDEAKFGVRTSGIPAYNGKALTASVKRSPNIRGGISVLESKFKQPIKADVASNPQHSKAKAPTAPGVPSSGRTSVSSLTALWNTKASTKVVPASQPRFSISSSPMKKSLISSTTSVKDNEEKKEDEPSIEQVASLESLEPFDFGKKRGLQSSQARSDSLKSDAEKTPSKPVVGGHSPFKSNPVGNTRGPSQAPDDSGDDILEPPSLTYGKRNDRLFPTDDEVISNAINIPVEPGRVTHTISKVEKIINVINVGNTSTEKPILRSADAKNEISVKEILDNAMKSNTEPEIVNLVESYESATDRTKDNQHKETASSSKDADGRKLNNLQQSKSGGSKESDIDSDGSGGAGSIKHTDSHKTKFSFFNTELENNSVSTPDLASSNSFSRDEQTAEASSELSNEDNDVPTKETEKCLESSQPLVGSVTTNGIALGEASADPAINSLRSPSKPLAGGVDAVEESAFVEEKGNESDSNSNFLSSSSDNDDGPIIPPSQRSLTANRSLPSFAPHTSTARSPIEVRNGNGAPYGNGNAYNQSHSLSPRKRNAVVPLSPLSTQSNTTHNSPTRKLFGRNNQYASQGFNKAKGVDGRQGQGQDKQGARSKKVRFRQRYPVPPLIKKARPPADIAKDNELGDPEICLHLAKPKPDLKQLLDAILGDSIIRRSNACGALKVLTSKAKNRLTLVRTAGVLDALVFAASVKIDEEETEVAIDARTRAVYCLLNVSEPKDNRAIVLSHKGLAQAIVKCIMEDMGEARSAACSALAMLAKTPACREMLAQVENLVDVLATILKDETSDFATEATLTIQAVDEDGSDDEASHGSKSFSSNSSSSSSSMDQYSARSIADVGSIPAITRIDSIREHKMAHNDETAKRGRLSACAALVHLSKHCPVATVLCKSDVLLTTLVGVSKEYDNVIHTKCFEIIANLTRFPSNNERLARFPNLVDALVSGGKVKIDADRLWSLRALQNLSSDVAGKTVLATAVVLNLLSVSSVRKQHAEQFCAVATLYNLSTEPGAVVPLTNTKNVVATLVHVAHNQGTETEIRLMACDALATLGLWLQTLAGAGSLPDTVQQVPLPSYISAGWKRWD